jgi:transposase
VRLVAPDAAAPHARPAPVSGIVAAPIEVVLRNGRVLRVAATADAEAVARLAAALEA